MTGTDYQAQVYLAVMNQVEYVEAVILSLTRDPAFPSLNCRCQW